MQSYLICKIENFKLSNILYGIFFSFSIPLWLLFLDFINFKCPIHEYLHLWCSGCGGTRMFFSILDFNFYQAFRYNPLVFILLVIFCIYFIISVIIYIKKKAIYLPSSKLLLILLFILISYMILRNISYFSYLIPTEV